LEENCQRWTDEYRDGEGEKEKEKEREGKEKEKRTEKTLLAVLQLEVLIGELVAVDGLATGTVALCEITTLDHEVLDDTVEGRALESEALLASSKSPTMVSLHVVVRKMRRGVPEVLGSLWDT